MVALGDIESAFGVVAVDTDDETCGMLVSRSMVASENFATLSPLTSTFGAEHTVFLMIVSMSNNGM